MTEVDRLLDSQGNEALPAGIRAEVQEAYASGDSDRINAIQEYYAFLPSPDLVNTRHYVCTLY